MRRPHNPLWHAIALTQRPLDMPRVWTNTHTKRTGANPHVKAGAKLWTHVTWPARKTESEKRQTQSTRLACCVSNVPLDVHQISYLLKRALLPFSHTLQQRALQQSGKTLMECFVVNLRRATPKPSNANLFRIFTTATSHVRVEPYRKFHEAIEWYNTSNCMMLKHNFPATVRILFPLYFWPCRTEHRIIIYSLCPIIVWWIHLQLHYYLRVCSLFLRPQGDSPFGKSDAYIKLEQLGEGSYATVYKGYSK